MGWGGGIGGSEGGDGGSEGGVKGGGADVTTVPCGSPDNTQKAMCGGARGDLLTVAELLRAAAVDLDALSNSTNKQQKPETIRHAGVALVLTVHYQAGAVVYGDGPKCDAAQFGATRRNSAQIRRNYRRNSRTRVSAKFLSDGAPLAIAGTTTK